MTLVLLVLFRWVLWVLRRVPLRVYLIFLHLQLHLASLVSVELPPLAVSEIQGHLDSLKQGVHRGPLGGLCSGETLLFLLLLLYVLLLLFPRRSCGCLLLKGHSRIALSGFRPVEGLELVVLLRSHID